MDSKNTFVRCPLFHVGRLWFVLLALVLAACTPAIADPHQPLKPIVTPDAATPARDTLNLYRDEIQQASVKLKWRGERFTENTTYAIAISGASWCSSWQKDHPCRLIVKPTRADSHGDVSDATRAEIANLFQGRDFAGVVSKSAAIAPETICTDADLKEPVGRSLIALGKYDRAFAVLSPCGFCMGDDESIAGRDLRLRSAAFEAARQNGDRKNAIVFAASLLLAPGAGTTSPNTEALDFLTNSGVDVDRVLQGVLECPDKLTGLHMFQYEAANLLVFRASARLVPFLIQLADTDDTYVQSRALLALGVATWKPKAGEPRGWSASVIAAPVREMGISSGERRMIAQVLEQAANNDRYRVRAAAVVAIAMGGDPSDISLLTRLAADRSYILSPARGKSDPRRITFPVRVAASLALSRYGTHIAPGGGEFTGKELDKARRGGKDVTGDKRGLDPDMAPTISPCVIDNIIGLAR